jgi:hypothetical protein
MVPCISCRVNPLLLTELTQDGTRPVVSRTRYLAFPHLHPNQDPIVAKDPREALLQSPYPLAAIVAFSGQS